MALQERSLTEYEIYEIFIEADRQVSKGTASSANSFMKIRKLLELREDFSEHQKSILNNIFRKYKHLKLKLMKKGGYKAILDSADKSSRVVENVAVDNNEAPNPPEKRRQSQLKGMDELSRKQLKRRTEEIFQSVKDVADIENISVTRLLGFLLTRSAENDKIRKIGENIWNETCSAQSKTLPVESSLVLYNDCRLGRQTYTKQKKLLDNEGFQILPSWNHLREKQKKITPIVKNLPEPFVGVNYSLVESLHFTIFRIMSTLDSTLLTSFNLLLNIKFGFDGSGSHAIYNQLKNEQTNNIIMSMFCPLELKTNDGASIWVQRSPNSPHTQRPVSLQMGKESQEALQSLRIFNDEMTQMKDDGIIVDYNSSLYNVKVNIVSHMMDMKAAHLYLGLGGAYCDLCSCSREQCLDLERIEGGFKIDRSVSELISLFDDHLGLEDGSVMKSKGDYDVRAGMTAKPIPTNETKSVQVLHALLRSFDFIMKIVVHLIAGVYDWTESKTNCYWRFLVSAKEKLQQSIFSFTGQKWDFPDSAGKGGTTTSGNTARVLLLNKTNRDFIVSQVPEKHKSTVKEVMLMLSVIIRVMSSKKEVNILAYKNLCIKLYVTLIKEFPRVKDKHVPGPWINITPSVHKLLGHSWELMQNNDNCGLGSLDEAGLEASNKILRSIRSNMSRKISQNTNLIDTINRMWVSSDPVVNNIREKTLPSCTSCEEIGHSARYCSKKTSINILSEEENLISILMTKVE